MGIGVEKSDFEDLLQQEVRQPLPEELAVTVPAGILEDPGQGRSFEELQGQHPLRGVAADRFGKPHGFLISEKGLELLQVQKLQGQVHFPHDLLAELLHQAAGIEQPGIRQGALAQDRQIFENLDVGEDDLFDIRPPDLDGYLRAVG